MRACSWKPLWLPAPLLPMNCCKSGHWRIVDCQGGAAESLAYESVLEMIAEQHHCSPRYLMRKPDLRFGPANCWQRYKVPHTAIKPCAARTHASLGVLNADVVTVKINIVARFPCSIATKAEKRPSATSPLRRLRRRPTTRLIRLIIRIHRKPNPAQEINLCRRSNNRWHHFRLSRASASQYRTLKSRPHGPRLFRLSTGTQRLAKMVRVGTPVRVDPQVNGASNRATG